MPSLTTNYSWNLPLVADPIDADLWGGLLNANLVSQDTIVKAISDNATTAVAFFDVGDIKPTARSTAPAKWLFCFGQAINRTTYASLFSALGTTYGAGDGSTTFNVPDIRGRVIAGQDDMGGTSADRLTSAGGGIDGDVLGASGGSEFMHQHTHTATQVSHAHTVPAWQGSGAGSPGVGYYNNGATQTNISTTTVQPAITVDNAGTGTSQNVQPTIVLNYLIYAGV